MGRGRGNFADMDKATQREIASRGGKRGHELGTAHEWTSEEARKAGMLGGTASQRAQRQQREEREKKEGES